MESSMELTTSFDNKLTIIEPQVNLHSQSPIEELGTDAILETTSDVQFEDDGNVYQITMFSKYFYYFELQALMVSKKILQVKCG